MDNRSQHWESIFRSKAIERTSWYRPHLDVSIELLQAAGLQRESRVIDIGAGASTLMDDLLALGLRNLLAVDVSAAALQISQRRLGAQARVVQWIVGDVTTLELPASSIDLWHDRAALHFLRTQHELHAYVDLASRAVAAGGFAVVATFAPDGPAECSGLPVVRRDAESIAGLFSSAFRLVQGRRETHTTPGGVQQPFAYALLQRTGR